VNRRFLFKIKTQAAVTAISHNSHSTESRHKGSIQFYMLISCQYSAYEIRQLLDASCTTCPAANKPKTHVKLSINIRRGRWVPTSSRRLRLNHKHTKISAHKTITFIIRSTQRALSTGSYSRHKHISLMSHSTISQSM